MSSEEYESGTHRLQGTGGETVVICEHDGGAYGPGGDREFIQCPYCGENARCGDHWIYWDVDEVYCEQTPMSTYRYCPGCGDRLRYPDSEQEVR